MGIGRGTKKEYYCYICKKEIVSLKNFKRHMYKHYDGKRCPLCQMQIKQFLPHLMKFHIKPNTTDLLYRDLAILVKESNNPYILYNPKLGLNKEQRKKIWKLASKR